MKSFVGHSMDSETPFKGGGYSTGSSPSECSTTEILLGLMLLNVYFQLSRYHSPTQSAAP